MPRSFIIVFSALFLIFVFSPFAPTKTTSAAQEEMIVGAVVKHGQALGIPTPIHKTICGALRPCHLKHLGAKQ